MFNFLSGKGSPQQMFQSCAVSAGAGDGANVNISYTPGLVKSLTSDHHQLLGLFEDAEVLFARNRVNLAVERLRKFARACGEHRMKEDVRLLIYLEHRFQHDETLYQRLRDFRRERDRNARRVREFIEKYEALEIDRDLEHGFIDEAKEVGALMVAYMEREEHEIYPLYERLSS